MKTVKGGRVAIITNDKIAPFFSPIKVLGKGILSLHFYSILQLMVLLG